MIAKGYTPGRHKTVDAVGRMAASVAVPYSQNEIPRIMATEDDKVLECPKCKIRANLVTSSKGRLDIRQCASCGMQLSPRLERVLNKIFIAPESGDMRY